MAYAESGVVEKYQTKQQHSKQKKQQQKNGLYIPLMGLIFARTNFSELENFAFREDLFSQMSCFTIFRGDLLSQIGYAENFHKY